MDIKKLEALWRADAEVLAQIGAHFFNQPTRINVNLPKHFADLAVTAWERCDGDGSDACPSDENLRYAAANLALIGCAIEQSGIWNEHGVNVELSAVFIGAAETLADKYNLL